MGGQGIGGFVQLPEYGERVFRQSIVDAGQRRGETIFPEIPALGSMEGGS